MSNSDPTNSQAQRPHGSSIVIPHSAEWHQKLLSWLIFTIARVCMWTWRIEWEDRAGLHGNKGPALFGIWHNRLAVSMSIYKYVASRRPSNGLAALISASRDGGLLAEVLAKFGVQAVRGSSSRRGPQALLEATSWAEKGYHVAITPDGPRGPRYQVQDGIIALAQVTGLPIVPVGVTVQNKVCTKSWDRFQIPLPFAKCRVILGQTISVPRGISDSEHGKYRRELEQAMSEINSD